MIGRRPALMAVAAVLLAVPVLVPAAPALAKTDWANMISATPQGILIGNPAAKVKIVEFASYTCSHCRAFHETGMTALKAKYIASGNVSLEQRSFIRNGPDFSASLLAACLAPRPAWAFAGALFAAQDDNAKKFIAMSDADNQAIAALPADQQPAKLAEVSGLDGWASTHGVPMQAGKACLRDKAAQEKLLAIRMDAITTYKLQGTPTFGINGVPVAGVFDWASLEPAVQAALK